MELPPNQYNSDLSEGSVVRNTYLGHNAWVQTVMWSTTEEFLFVSGAYDNQNKLWDCRSPKAPLYDLLGHGEKVLDIDWSIPSTLYLVVSTTRCAYSNLARR